MTSTALSPTPALFRGSGPGGRDDIAGGHADAAEAVAAEQTNRSSAAAPADPRWAGRFRRMEHRRDDEYRSVTVAVCGAALVSVGEWVRLPRCSTCFPAARR
ncbi:hypothetical protein FHR81_000080 [Actinoalloteichus hoggarensis]|uniref:Uncharacterized protein n=1 Tax=Actinoalloteichus hoggarensis TaxID=1470176 RepID=A0A221W375_9PSEU|nr:hypothetical protein [Actinoalloteichus hoggarensis]ASO20235.1 hypothetical protein AHOG_12960 [Actinoalloteichus hoggarensis]MBB5919051.1 hypothetical protein [Actinoalloteichus hoggarensis]